MSEPTTTATRPPLAGSMKANQMMIVGRIEHVSKFDGKFDHVIVTPAQDEYSKPSFCRISATDRLGNVGDNVKCLSQFNGWPNKFDTREGEKVFDVRGFFVAVE